VVDARDVMQKIAAFNTTGSADATTVNGTEALGQQKQDHYLHPHHHKQRLR